MENTAKTSACTIDMTEAEKLDTGLEYDFWDAEVNGRKLNAIEGCQRRADRWKENSL